MSTEFRLISMIRLQKFLLSDYSGAWKREGVVANIFMIVGCSFFETYHFSRELNILNDTFSFIRI